MIYDFNTKNTSFLNIHNILKNKGIQNNKFFLRLDNEELLEVNPFSDDLSDTLKDMVIRECVTNYWYFLRVIARIPMIDGNIIPYELNLANLAFNYCTDMRLNVYFQTINCPTDAIVGRLLWEHNFGNINNQCTLFDTYHSNTLSTLQKIKEYRNLLPEYLRFNDYKVDTIETLINSSNNNKIIAMPAARDVFAAKSLSRLDSSCSRIYFNNFSTIRYNDTFIDGIIPLFCKTYDRKYGIIINSTPVLLDSHEAEVAHNMEKTMLRFSESFYDKSRNEITANILNSKYPSFIFIKYNYRELGFDEQWFIKTYKILNNNWNTIKREILLEW